MLCRACRAGQELRVCRFQVSADVRSEMVKGLALWLYGAWWLSYREGKFLIDEPSSGPWRRGWLRYGSISGVRLERVARLFRSARRVASAASS